MAVPICSGGWCNKQ